MSWEFYSPTWGHCLETGEKDDIPPSPLSFLLGRIDFFTVCHRWAQPLTQSDFLGVASRELENLWFPCTSTMLASFQWSCICEIQFDHAFLHSDFLLEKKSCWGFGDEFNILIFSKTTARCSFSNHFTWCLQIFPRPWPLDGSIIAGLSTWVVCGLFHGPFLRPLASLPWPWEASGITFKPDMNIELQIGGVMWNLGGLGCIFCVIFVNLVATWLL